MISTRLTWLPTIAATLAMALSAACAKPSAPTPEPNAEPAEPTEPPRMLSRGSFPELRISGPNPADRPVARIRIQVMIDPQGRPDLNTLRVSGLGASENRLAIERWISSASFRPAMRNGQPVSGLYETRFEVRVSVRRLE